MRASEQCVTTTNERATSSSPRPRMRTSDRNEGGVGASNVGGDREV